MSNQLTALQKQYYSKMVQKELYFKVSALSLANMVPMPHGTTYHKPLIDFNPVQSYVKNTDITVSDNVTADETLTIDKTPLVATGIDAVELLEIDFSLLDTVAKNAAQVIREDLDGKFFAQILNATNSGAAVKLTTGASSNTVNVFSQAVASLVNEGVDENSLYTVSDPHSIATIGESALGNTYKEADLEFRRGFRGQFVGTTMVRSTLLTATTSLALATNPTSGDTVTINGVVFKFVAAPADAGDVDIAGSAAASVDNLVLAINGTGTPGTSTYIEVSNRDRTRKLSGITAVDATTSITLTSTKGYRVVSQTLTNASDKWAAVIVNNCIMEKGSISLAVQKGINVITRDKPLQLGTNFFTWMRYGLKTFTEGADRMYRLQIIVQDAE